MRGGVERRAWAHNCSTNADYHRRPVEDGDRQTGKWAGIGRAEGTLGPET